MGRMWEALSGDLGWRVLTSRTMEPLHAWLANQLGVPADPQADDGLIVFDSARDDG